MATTRKTVWRMTMMMMMPGLLSMRESYVLLLLAVPLLCLVLSHHCAPLLVCSSRRPCCCCRCCCCCCCCQDGEMKTQRATDRRSFFQPDRQTKSIRSDRLPLPTRNHHAYRSVQACPCCTFPYRPEPNQPARVAVYQLGSLCRYPRAQQSCRRRCRAQLKRVGWLCRSLLGCTIFIRLWAIRFVT